MLWPTTRCVTNSRNFRWTNSFIPKATFSQQIALVRWIIECNRCILDFGRIRRDRMVMHCDKFNQYPAYIIYKLFSFLLDSHIGYLEEPVYHVFSPFYNSFYDLLCYRKVASALLSSMFWILWFCFYKFQTLFLPTRMSSKHRALHFHRQIAF